MEKINKDVIKNLNNTNSNLHNIFGNWIHNSDNLREQFLNAKPFPYIIIDNFLNNDYVELISKNYPTDFENWHKYYNPLEVKYANDNINDMVEPIKNLFYVLSTNNIINKFSNISNITNLEYDPYLHGAGLHAHPRYGRLNMHLDYEKHPILNNKERRLNIILFLNKTWKEEWNGDNQLWDLSMQNCIAKTFPKFNRAIIFNTNEISWHGVPNKILCPENIYRKSLAYYYISPLSNKNTNYKFGDNGSGYRTKAAFIKRPSESYSLKMQKLYDIRPYRRIEKKDMDFIWPDWTPEKY